MARFERLTKGLLNVSREQLKREDECYQIGPRKRRGDEWIKACLTHLLQLCFVGSGADVFKYLNPISVTLTTTGLSIRVSG
jgi:hypothetical protein